MAGNNIYVQGSYVDIHDNEVVNLSVDKAQVRLGDSQLQPQQSDVPEVKILVESVDEVRDYFWGDSSMAVIFGVCRDCFQYADNMRQFERDFGCVEGLISNTFRNNPYMRLAVGKWGQQGAKQRVLRLVDAYKNEVSKRLKLVVPTE